MAWIPTILFPAIVGVILSGLTGISKSNKVNRILKIVFMSLFALLFLISFFVFKQFKVFYDLATMLYGAGGVAGQFMDHVWKLIFSPSGLLAIALYVVPIGIYIWKGKEIDDCKNLNQINLIALAVVLAVALIINVPVISFSNILSGVYNERYNFQSAVTDFGLLTGLRLDVQRRMLRTSGKNSTTIIPSNQTEEPSAEDEDNHVEKEESDATENAVVTYEKSVLDIDFKKLADETENQRLANMDRYVASLTPSSQNEYTGMFKGKNLILITAEAFSDKIIDPELTPTLYRLSTKGINFTDYYQQASAGTIGGEYQHLFGLFPSDGGESFLRMSSNLTWFTMASQLGRLGYYGIPYHNGDYTYYNRQITHNSIGYSEEYLAFGNGMEEMISDGWPRSDLEMIETTVPTYINKRPFNVYYMTVSGHSIYNFKGNTMAIKNEEYVKDIEGSEALRSYIACNLELEFALASLVKSLEDAGIADDTVIVLTTDHFPYGLDEDGYLGNLPILSELYGFEPQNYLERDKNRLIMWCGSLEKDEPIIVDTPVSSLDILPTLSNLFGLDWDSRLLPGRDVFSDASPLVFNFMFDWKTDKGTYIANTATFTPAEGVTVDSGYVDRINKIVSDKMDFCWDEMELDYYRHVIVDSGYIDRVPPVIDWVDSEDAETDVNDAGVELKEESEADNDSDTDSDTDTDTDSDTNSGTDDVN